MKDKKNLKGLKPSKPKFIKKPYMAHDPFVWAMAINRTFPDKEIIADGDRWKNAGEDYKELCENLYNEGYRICEKQINGHTIDVGGMTMTLPIRTVFYLKK